MPIGDGSDVTLNGIAQEDFDAFLQRTGLIKYRGRIAPRNGFHSPWVSRIDVRFAQELPNPLGHRGRFMVDIENVGNLLNNKWGRVDNVTFPYMTPAVEVSYDAATGEAWGNFPQTYSMVGIINGAMRLSRHWESTV